MYFEDFGTVTPEQSIDIEQRLFRDSPSNTVAIFTRDRPTVSLGRFSDIETSIDVSFAEEHDISIIRRMSGGSAIYCDSDQITYTVITDRDRFNSKTESYETVCQCLVRTLGILGIEAVYKPENDVLVNGMKISGCAQYRDRARLLHHGSLILRLDSETMDKVLRPIKDRKYGRLTSIEEYLGHIPKREEMCKAFKEGFADL